jgi:hypothetical protein
MLSVGMWRYRHKHVSQAPVTSVFPFLWEGGLWRIMADDNLYIAAKYIRKHRATDDT